MITTPFTPRSGAPPRSEEHTSELQSRLHLVCRLLLEKKKIQAPRNEIPTSSSRDAETAQIIDHASDLKAGYMFPRSCRMLTSTATARESHTSTARSLS